MLAQTVANLAEFRFNDPEQDHLRIRQHAAVSGYRDALRDVLNFDSRIAELAEKNLEQAKQEAFSQTPEETGE